MSWFIQALQPDSEPNSFTLKPDSAVSRVRNIEKMEIHLNQLLIELTKTSWDDLETVLIIFKDVGDVHLVLNRIPHLNSRRLS